MPNRPMAIGTKLMPSLMSGMPNVMRGTPELTSTPTRPSSTPTTIMAIALGGEPCASTTAPSRPRTMRLDGLDRRELEREGGERQAQQRDDDGRDRAGEERRDGGDGERGAGASLPGHLVAVDAGDDRGGFARAR